MAAVILISLPLLTRAVSFAPETSGLLANGLTTLPIPYNLTGSQTDLSASSAAVAGSFWASSFVHASNGHDYMIVSQVIAGLSNSPSTSSTYRGSVLDITDTSRYKQFEFFSNISDLFTPNGDFNASFPDYGFASVAPQDGNPTMRTWSSISGAEFDLTFQLSSPALLNGGLGFFPVEDSTINEWSVPAGKTTGWLAVDETKVAVEAQKSLTWYDRQWNGAPSSWTWFELHVNSGSTGDQVTPISIWTYNTTTGSKGFATIRDVEGRQFVESVASIQLSNRTYTSQASGLVFPLDGILELGDGTTFNISSVRPDQELYGVDEAVPTYEGYVTVEGMYQTGGVFSAYGLVEVNFM